MTSQTQDWKAKLSTFSSTLQILSKETSRRREPALFQLLSDVCQYIQEVEARGHPEFDQLAEGFDRLLNSAIDVASRKMEIDFLRPFTITNQTPLLKDQIKPEANAGTSVTEACTSFVQFMTRRFPDHDFGESFKPPSGLSPWRKARLPHASSSLLSRFRRPFQTSAQDTTPLAQTIYQARCEVTTDSIIMPSQMAISPSGSCLAVTGAGGWKNRDPILSFYMLDGDSETMLSSGGVQSGLSGIGRHLAMDEKRKLAFIADNYRIKSYSWEADKRGERGAPVHTLHSENYEGPLALLANGRLMRMGKGSAAVWNLDDMDTYAEKRIIGGKFVIKDSWREEDQIERSAGNLPSTTIKYSNPSLSIGVMRYNQPSNQFLCGGDRLVDESAASETSYSCFQLDIEAGAKVVKRYLGHGDTVTDISTSDGDPNTFLTACSDGCVRLYDTRHALPTMTLDAGQQAESCDAAVLLHPNGIPSVFTGGDTSERVMLWDIRAGKVVYELSTGNASVRSLVWDDRRSTLFAATTCPNLTSNGDTFNYRYAKKPDFKYCGDTGSETGDDVPATEEELSALRGTGTSRTRKHNDHDAMDAEDEDGEDNDEDDDDDDMDDDDEDDDDGEWGPMGDNHWPKTAYHSENSFGHFFDAAEHSIMSYRFKADPDTDLLPASGWSSVESRGGGGGFW